MICGSMHMLKDVKELAESLGFEEGSLQPSRRLLSSSAPSSADVSCIAQRISKRSGVFDHTGQKLLLSPISFFGLSSVPAGLVKYRLHGLFLFVP
jgi:hypothetical protein